MAQTQRDHRATLQSLIEAWRCGDALRAAAHFSSDGRYGEAGAEFFRDGPRWRFDVDDMILESDRACVVYRFAVEGAGVVWRERAGCAIVAFDAGGAIAAWREYEG